MWPRLLLLLLENHPTASWEVRQALCVAVEYPEYSTSGYHTSGYSIPTYTAPHRTFVDTCEGVSSVDADF
jgi:hypothetical protein